MKKSPVFFMEYNRNIIMMQEEKEIILKYVNFRDNLNPNCMYKTGILYIKVLQKDF